MNYLFNSYTTINTYFGKVKGLNNKYKNGNLFIFYQIPYAVPPIKSLRWKKTLKWNSKYKGIYDATKYNNVSHQHEYYYYNYYNNFSNKYLIKKNKYVQSEDCLYLDIYTPTIERNKYPVIVCIHGGHYQYGYSRNMRINKEFAVDNNIIYITINYRLGIFGFFQHNELKNEKNHGNFGIYDIITALKWIKNNIFYYGGDPDNITLEGQGSGANLIALLMCIDECIDDNLFHKAILHSLSCLYKLKDMSKESSEIADFLVGQGNNQLQRLRNISEYKINNYYNSIHDFSKLFIPNIDNYIIFHNILDVFKKGLQMKIPLIIGYNSNDCNILYDLGFCENIPYPINNKKYNKSDISDLNKIYININKKNIYSLKRYYNDYFFTYINKKIAEYHIIYAKTYIYVLKFINVRDSDIECCFELDLMYFYNNNNSYNIYIDDELKQKILQYIQLFIKNKNPWNEFKNDLAMFFNKETYMNFFYDKQSLNIINKNFDIII